jgi:hypothetical protein
MSEKKTRKKPLWVRATKDKDAAAWLKKNRKEFPSKSFLPDPIEFGSRRKHANEQIALLIAAQMPFENKQQQRLAELFLSMPPREIARVLRVDRKTIYLRIRALKKFVLERHRAEKAALVHGRGEQVPNEAQTRILQFTLNERTEFAYLVGCWWCDEFGLQFPAEIQDILNELDEHEAGFEVLDVEEP